MGLKGLLSLLLLCQGIQLVQGSCGSGEFQCTSGQCINIAWRCDGTKDCTDDSDELNCLPPSCSSQEFKCVTSGECISLGFVCDGEDDCIDGSDEQRTCGERTCSPDQFTCQEGQCIPKIYRCDHVKDCVDNSDENNCNYPHCTEKTCANGACYNNSQHCNGLQDCRDGSDEFNCTTQHCPIHQYQCANGYCIPHSFVCDHWNDCGDNSDEQGCVYQSCSGNEFTCSSGRCIPQHWVCDQFNDCGDYSDERGCDSNSRDCYPGEWGCPGSTVCIPVGKVCDDKPDCPGGTDETNSTAQQTCNPCNPNPCSHGSTCEARAEQTFICLCLPGDYYNHDSNICERAKVFPGQLNWGKIYEKDMAVKTSQIFQDTSEDIIDELASAFGSGYDYTETIVLELRPNKQSNVWSRADPSTTVAALVEVIFKANSDITSQQVGELIETEVNCEFNDTSLCSNKTCDESVSTCTSENGQFNCTCEEHYIPTNFSDRLCIACPSGQKASGSKCVDCPFGHSGFNCQESWKLILVIVGSVLGGLLLISLIVLAIVASKPSKKKSKKNKDEYFGKPYASHSLAKAQLVNSSQSLDRSSPYALAGYDNAGAARIPRATTNISTKLEMTPSNMNTRFYNDTNSMNSNPYTTRNPSSGYAQTRPQNNPYALNRPQINPYASSQGQTNAYYMHDDGRRFN